MKFVFDLDGTICFKGQPVSEKILSALEKLVGEGHEVIFASARPIRDLLPILHERFYPYPLIGGNGSMIRDKGKTISTVSFDKETFENISQLMRLYNVSYLIDSDWDYAYTGPRIHPILNNLDPHRRAKNVKIDELKSILKILLLTSDDMEAIHKELSKLDVVVHSHGHERVLDISPSGIDKWSGLQKLGVQKGEYIAFGNDANDITMFQHAKYSIMIGESKQLAPYSFEQLLLSEDFESHLEERLTELAYIYPVTTKNVLNS